MISFYSGADKFKNVKKPSDLFRIEEIDGEVFKDEDLQGKVIPAFVNKLKEK